MEIRDIIRQIVSDKFTGGAKLCKVISTSGSMCNVTTIENEVELKEVRLQTDSSNGILITPSVGSFVVVVPIADFEFIVVMYSEIDSIKLLDGSFGGLTKVDELTEKLNNLESLVNNLLSALQGVSIPLAPSGTYPFAPLFSSYQPLTQTQVSDLENEKITHGTT